MNNAVRSVKEGSLTLHGASVQFSIPRTTLRRHLDENMHSIGVPSIFTYTQEFQLVERMLYLAMRGFSCHNPRVEFLCKIHDISCVVIYFLA
jgi:hypothetical protein